MPTYSTRDVIGRAKVSHWNEIISEVFTPLETKPVDRDNFDAEVKTAQFGRLWLANAVSMPATVLRSRKHADNETDQRYFLHMQMKGSLKVSQDGKDATLNEGDLVLCDNTIPYSLAYDQPCSTLVLIVPGDDMKKHLPSPEQVIGVKLSGKQGLSQTVSLMLDSIWRQCQDGLPPEIGSRIADSLLDVFATAWTATHGASVTDTAVTGSRRVQVKRYIEANLRDPELSVRSVAAAFGISPRYLHMLFAPENETVSSYILRRRLEECVKQLTDVVWRKRTITEIAFGWGFNNATHFARVFRDQYGASPRDYRNSHCPEAGMRITG